MAAMAAVLGAASAGAAQQLPLLEEPPPASQMICGPAMMAADPATDPAIEGEVARLVDAATQAMILGDLQGAREFLDRALRRDPNAADAIYLRGRVLIEQGAAAEATESFCRYLQIEPDGPSAEEARLRLDEAVEAGVGADLYSSFANGVELFHAGEHEASAAAFSAILDSRPGAAAAIRNRAVALGAMGQSGAARADLELYRGLLPPESDERAEIDAMLAWLDTGATMPSPGSALALGLVVPGGGQFYTRRPLLGTTLLGAAAAALAAGILHKETTVFCRQPDNSDNCPPDQVADRDTERPWLGAALGVAAALTVGSAIEAALHARNARRPPSRPARNEPPTPAGAERFDLVRVGGRAAVRVELLRIPIGGPSPDDPVP